ncbi:MAG: hypothetical protein NUV77_02220 [Thermoguttaceae bacterium]|nr:hypothetical protein [Thermoguttaceae bacterium]
MRAYPTRVVFAVVVGLFCLSGAQCPFLRPPADDYSYLPPALPPSPTLAQVIEVVNANAGQIERFSTSDAVLSGTGFPALRASIAFERPRRFRLVAGTGVTGPEVDLGSNDEGFWFWVRRNEPPALYYCRHDEFAASPVRRQLPIDPYWLIEAFGITYLDPALPHSNPIPVAGGRYEIHTTTETPQGPAVKVTVIDGVRGWVLEQRIYDSRRQLVASASSGRFRRDPLSGAFFPTIIDVRSPVHQFAMRVDLASVTVNRPLGNPERLWAMPHYEGWPAVDLCNPAAAR